MKLKIINTIIFVLVLFTFNLFAQGEQEMDKIQSVLHELKHTYAPDSRTAVFQVNVEKDSSKYVINGETNIPEAKDHLMSELKGNNIIDQVKVLPGEELGDKIYGIVDLSVANLRAKPENAAELVSQALLGTPLKILKEKRGWSLVQTPDKYISWIENDQLFKMNYDSLTEWDNADKIIYTKDFGFTYSNPDEKSGRVTDIVIGDILEYSGKENGFCKVKYPDGKSAFVNAGDCKPVTEWLKDANPTAANIIKTAKSFMGIPYLWGGTSIKGMDCSGFTKTVFFLYGIILPRDASQQVNVGIPVNTEDRLENLQPGDLLFFGKKGNELKKPKITHVAIYIGDGDFINASGEIKINSFSKDKPNYSAYRDDSFVCARRVLNSIGSNGVVTYSNNKFYNEDK
ncbi:MAG: C40 family peptidase [Ignavibacteriaceae bacterium]